MTGMLASVNRLEEALLVERLQVDIIDLKQPEQGALGALAIPDVRLIVDNLRPESVISATIGDLPMEPNLLADAVLSMAATGVDFVKIGFFPGGKSQACLDRLALCAEQGVSMIAVLFADGEPDYSLIPALSQAGFAGVMLDTMHKQSGTLLTLKSAEQLSKFVITARSAQLLTGLAGSLRMLDIAQLLPLQPDYLGFRGALCAANCRTGQLSVDQVQAIRLSIPRPD